MKNTALGQHLFFNFFSKITIVFQKAMVCFNNKLFFDSKKLRKLTSEALIRFFLRHLNVKQSNYKLM